MPVSERFYLADAVFVVAVEGKDELLERLHHALRHPAFLPYLGRRSCPPSRKVSLGVRDALTVEAALDAEPWRASAWHQQRRRGHAEVQLDTLIEPDPAGAAPNQRIDSLRDQPLSFDPRHRRYALRGVVPGTVIVANPAAHTNAPDHDPIAALREV